MKYYTTGEFSSITGFSQKALRIYHKKGLLKPAYVDQDTSYRYYNNLNLIDSNIIKELKRFGCSLEEIKEYLTERGKESMINIYSEKLIGIEKEIKRLQNIYSMLRVCVKNYTEQYSEDIVVKNIPERKIIFIRRNSACNPEEFAVRYFELLEIIRKKRTGFVRYMAIFHDEPETFNPASADIEVAAEVKEDQKNFQNYRIINEGLYLTLVFKGKYSEIIEGYRKITCFAAENNLIKNGPAIEIYYTDFVNEKNQENFITELQVPVKTQ